MKDPFKALRDMGVTMTEVHPTEPPRVAKRGKRTPKVIVEAVRTALRDHRGLSAATIAWVLVPELRDYCEGMCGGCGLGNHPHDPDDFSRCRRIVALIPNGTARLTEVAEAFSRTTRAWARLAKAWTALETLWLLEEQRTDRRMPKLYARMQELTR
ncbi:MAG TPA: hypothetical protein VJN18_32350 [Polyangiaceae bacterium]|nr:hypothetical protein [Polyangiaceae bacterium]